MPILLAVYSLPEMNFWFSSHVFRTTLCLLWQSRSLRAINVNALKQSHNFYTLIEYFYDPRPFSFIPNTLRPKPHETAQHSKQIEITMLNNFVEWKMWIARAKKELFYFHGTVVFVQVCEFVCVFLHFCFLFKALKLRTDLLNVWWIFLVFFFISPKCSAMRVTWKSTVNTPWKILNNLFTLTTTFAKVFVSRRLPLLWVIELSNRFSLLCRKFWSWKKNTEKNERTWMRWAAGTREWNATESRVLLDQTPRNVHWIIK